MNRECGKVVEGGACDRALAQGERAAWDDRYENATTLVTHSNTSQSECTILMAEVSMSARPCAVED